MSISAFSLADSSVSEVTKESSKKLPPKRIFTAVPDRTIVPEPR
ncbi:hypothetical protein [Sphingomonas alba]|nr:hypothetical protein [Sphingomonas alba]